MSAGIAGNRDMFGADVDASVIVRIGVGVIVVRDDGSVLLEKRADCGLWGLPGGRVDPGESLTEAAVREVQEETGLTVTLRGLVGVYSDPNERRIATYPDNGDRVHLVDAVLEAGEPRGALTRSVESEELVFFEPANIPWNEVCAPARKPLADFLAGKRGVVA